MQWWNERRTARRSVEACLITVDTVLADTHFETVTRPKLDELAMLGGQLPSFASIVMAKVSLGMYYRALCGEIRRSAGFFVGYGTWCDRRTRARQLADDAKQLQVARERYLSVVDCLIAIRQLLSEASVQRRTRAVMEQLVLLRPYDEVAVAALAQSCQALVARQRFSACLLPASQGAFGDENEHAFQQLTTEVELLCDRLLAE